jgi:hypothetical protein
MTEAEASDRTVGLEQFVAAIEHVDQGQGGEHEDTMGLWAMENGIDIDGIVAGIHVAFDDPDEAQTGEILSAIMIGWRMREAAEEARRDA